jgi:aspartate/methionine/tyrosine aminotransferase
LQYEVMVTAGANQAFVNLVLTLCDESDRVVLFKPYYFNHMCVRGVAWLHFLKLLLDASSGGVEDAEPEPLARDAVGRGLPGCIHRCCCY